MKEQFFHVPVLSHEVLQFFEEISISVFLDATLGLGNHAKTILSSHPEIKTYIGIDQDEKALLIAKETLSEWSAKTKFHHANFENLDQVLQKEKIAQADGILFDLGTSSMQLDDPERGFSFGKAGPLDMRMDRSKKVTAEQIVNQFSEKELESIFTNLGEEPCSKKIAKAIVERRKKKRIENTKELADLIIEAKGFNNKKKIHPATLAFQALRIYVNDELNAISRGIRKAVEKLSPNGRMVVITFHSLEDRIVKELFKELTRKEHVNAYKVEQKPASIRLLSKKPILPGRNEIKQNPRSRSGKMRVIEKTNE
jgi:16S rRNA (cytosine1402-N4)-methyltransferase